MTAISPVCHLLQPATSRHTIRAVRTAAARWALIALTLLLAPGPPGRALAQDPVPQCDSGDCGHPSDDLARSVAGIRQARADFVTSFRHLLEALPGTYGDEGPAYCGEVARRTGAKIVKAARVRGGADINALEAFHTDYHLLDAHQPGRFGGTGTTFDWELVHRRRTTTPFILSGGLNPENVADAIAATSPFAVDTASGTEVRPGVKDPERLRAFAAAVAATAPEAGAGAELAEHPG